MENYLNDDTIAALSSAAGKSAIAVLRISGSKSFQIIQTLFTPYSRNKNQVQVGFISNEGRKIDEAVCLFFRHPRSYTGEDLVELSVHGNPIIVKEVLDLIIANGARQALPGEFTYRAFLNGKKDLAQSEAVCCLIGAKTEKAVCAALNNIGGGFSEKINALKADLTRFMAYLEASLDYPEDDIPFLTQEQKIEMTQSLTKANQKLIDGYKTGRILQNGLKAAIVGKPNVGKSSLLNAMLGRERAIVTDIAGTTTDTIEEMIDCRGIPLLLVDTAGIGNKTKDPIETIGQEKTLQALSLADILIWVFDASEPLDAKDFAIAENIKTLNFKGDIFLALNKSDLHSINKEGDIENFAPNRKKIIKVSAKTGKGIEILLDEIAAAAGISENQTDLLMINLRHQNLLIQAQKALLGALKIVKEKNEDEIACYEARNALSAFEEILGINVATDILDEIFGNFCIGK